MSDKSVTIYDTTLRDGTQGEGINFSLIDKLRIAEKLDDFGVDYIEGGWPGSNPKDVEFFAEAGKRKWNHAKIAAFGSTRRANVKVEDDSQIRTLLEAETPVITYFAKSWKLHVLEVLRTELDENLAMIRDTAAHLKANGREVIHDAEHFFDGFKDDPDYALATLCAAQEGGVGMVVLCDTNGGTQSDEVAAITGRVREELDVPVGIHSHDDCGLGVANALAAVRTGASQVQGTINGYGERTGNCNLTSVIPNLQIKMGIEVVPDLRKLRELSLYVDDLANFPHDRRAPFVGTTAFSHKGGMHVNAVQKLARSYEHIDPREVGNRQHILVSELSGQSNVLLKAEELGYELEKGSGEVAAILRRVKELEKEGYEFEAALASFDLLIQEAQGRRQQFFKLQEYHCTFRRSGRNSEREYETCEATVKVLVNGKREYVVEEGDGPVNALDGALRKALAPFYPQVSNMSLLDYKVRIIDSQSGTAAKTRVLIDSGDGKESWGTVGVSFNIIEASWLALVDSVNYYLSCSKAASTAG